MAPVLLSLIPLLVPGPVDAYGDRLPRGAIARLGSVRWRCPDAPAHLIWSPDGKYLVGMHGASELTVWEYPAGVVRGRCELPELVSDVAGALTADQVQWTSDGRRLLIYGGDNRLVSVRVPDGRTELVGTGGHHGVAVALAADGRRALLEVPGREENGDKWNDLCVLDLDSPGSLRRLWNRQVVSRVDRGLMGHDDHPAPAARITADGRFVVAASVRQYDASYAVFDLATGRSRPVPDGTFRDITVSPDGRTLLSADADGRLARWAFAPAAWLRPVPLAGPLAESPDGWSLPGHFGPGGRVAVRSGGREGGRDTHAERSITVTETGTLRKLHEWSYRPGDEVLVRKGKTTVFDREGLGGLPATCAVAPDNRTLAVASNDSPRVRFFDLRTGAELRPAGGHAAAVIALRRVGPMLVSVGSDRVGRLWEWPHPGRSGRKEVEVFDHWEDDFPPAPAAAAGIKVLYERDRHRVEARDTRTEDVVWERPLPGAFVPHPERPRSLPIVEDAAWGRVAIAAGELVAICDLETGEELAELRTPGCWATAIEFDRDPHALAVGYHDGQILVWDLRPGDLPRRRPTDAEFAALWADLGGSPRTAARTRSAFLDDPAATLRWLDTHLRPLDRPTEFDIELCLARLAHPRFAEREAATRQLVRHFDLAGPAVRELLEVTKSPEVAHRLQMVLDRQANLGGDGEVVRLVRVVAFLERMSSPEARKLLERLARGGGVPAERAKEALRRLTAGRSANSPPGPTGR